jgi:hypothetical protein
VTGICRPKAVQKGAIYWATITSRRDLMISTNEKLARHLQDCVTACEYCTGACIKENESMPLARCILRDLDCADACRFALSMMARGSESANGFLESCAAFCDKCAAECRSHPMDHCKACAAACEACAAVCRQQQTNVALVREEGIRAAMT